MTTFQRNAFLAICALGSMLMISTMTGSLMAYVYKSYPEIPQTTVQLIMAVPSLFAIFASFAAGPIALKVNKKYLLLFAAAANLAYFIVFALFGVSGPFTVLLIASAISGISRGSSMTLMNSAIGEIMGPEKSANYIAVAGAVLHGGAVIIGVFGGIIAAVDDGAAWNNAYYLGLLIIPTIIVFAKMMPKEALAARTSANRNEENTDTGETHARNERESIPAKAYTVVILVVVIFISISAFLLNISYYVISEHELGTSADAGFINSLFIAVGVLVGLIYSRWAKLLKDWSMPVCCLISSLGFVLMIIFTRTPAGAYAAALLLGFAFSTIIPYNTGYLIAITPPRLIPLSVALFSGSMNLGMFVSPFVLNGLSPIFGGGMNGILLAGIVLAFMCSVASVFLFPLSRRKV